MWFIITHSFWCDLYFLYLLSQVSYPVGNVPIHQSGMYSLDDLPKTAVRSFSQSSCVMSMDFHPVQQSVLLGTNFIISFNIFSLFVLLYQYLFLYCLTVGNNVGDIAIWDVGTRDRLAHRPFKVWDINLCSMPMQVYILS